MDVDDALEELIAAARAHLAAVRAAAGATDDADVWRTFVTLNNASHRYDQLLMEVHGEVTPWELEPIDVRDASAGAQPYLTRTQLGPVGEKKDPHEYVVSVRQRRDYRVPSVSMLLAATGYLVREVAPDGEEVTPPRTVAGAVQELLRIGDGTLGALDVTELEPLTGAITVVEAREPLAAGTADYAGLFQLGPRDRVVSRLDDPPSVPPALPG